MPEHLLRYDELRKVWLIFDETTKAWYQLELIDPETAKFLQDFVGYRIDEAGSYIFRDAEGREVHELALRTRNQPVGSDITTATSKSIKEQLDAMGYEGPWPPIKPRVVITDPVTFRDILAPEEFDPNAYLKILDAYGLLPKIETGDPRVVTIPGYPELGLFMETSPGRWESARGDAEPGEFKPRVIRVGGREFYELSKGSYTPVESLPEAVEPGFVTLDGVRFFQDRRGNLTEHKKDRWTVEEVKGDLIRKATISGDWDAVLELNHYLTTDFERLQQAMRLAEAPGDYLTIVGMMRGEIPSPVAPGEYGRLAPPASSRFFQEAALQAFQPTDALGEKPPLDEQVALGEKPALGEQVPPVIPLDGTIPPPGFQDSRIGGSPHPLPPRPPDEKEEDDIGTGPAISEKEIAQLFQTEQGNGEGYGDRETTLALEDATKPGPSALGGQLPTTQGYPSYIREALGRQILSGAALTPRKQLPALGGMRFPSAQALRRMSPIERDFFKTALAGQGISGRVLDVYEEQRKRATIPAGERRKRIRYRTQRI